MNFIDDHDAFDALLSMRNLWDHLLRNRGQSSNNQTKEGLQDQEQSTREVHSDGPSSPNNIIDSMDDIPITFTVVHGSNGGSSSDEPNIGEHVGNGEDELTLEEEVEKSTEDDIDINFKKIDMVEDCTDHYHEDCKVDEPSKEWVKKIQHEWKLLKRDLPETIFFQVYEKRMDLLRAVIIGPPGTPYDNGLFFFDCHFPATYPEMPPLVHYISYGLQPNPNLNADGMVCISLLGMWSENAWERWNPKESTMLQVLVSIQALVLNSEPFFNRAANEDLKNTIRGYGFSARYNENVFFMSCKTMMFTIRNPPKSTRKTIQDRWSAI